MTVSLDESLIRRQPAELSGGQQQRVGIARGLALKPRLLVADEPVSALDVSVQAQILNLLADLKKRYGLTLILISHSLYAVHYLCTSISVMYRGRIVEEAPAAGSSKSPEHPYSRILLDSHAGAGSVQAREHSSSEEKDSGSILRAQVGVFFLPALLRMPCHLQRTDPASGGNRHQAKRSPAFFICDSAASLFTADKRRQSLIAC